MMKTKNPNTTRRRNLRKNRKKMKIKRSRMLSSNLSIRQLKTLWLTKRVRTRKRSKLIQRIRRSQKM